MFRVTIALEDGGEHETFTEAFTEFYNKVKELVGKGTTHRILETACWIALVQEVDGETIEVPMFIGDASDLAREVGILTTDGSLVEPAPEVSSAQVMNAFSRAVLHTLSAILQIQSGTS